MTSYITTWGPCIVLAQGPFDACVRPFCHMDQSPEITAKGTGVHYQHVCRRGVCTWKSMYLHLPMNLLGVNISAPIAVVPEICPAYYCGTHEPKHILASVVNSRGPL